MTTPSCPVRILLLVAFLGASCVCLCAGDSSGLANLTDVVQVVNSDRISFLAIKSNAQQPHRTAASVPLPCTARSPRPLCLVCVAVTCFWHTS